MEKQLSASGFFDSLFKMNQSGSLGNLMQAGQGLAGKRTDSEAAFQVINLRSAAPC